MSLAPTFVRICRALWPALAAVLAMPSPTAAQALINGCSESARDACLYRSTSSFTTRTADALLIDPARANHPVPIRVRYPVGATGARPVVIWNHGGATTGADPAATAAAGLTVSRGQQSSQRRSESFARAGYVVIHIGRLPPGSLSAAQTEGCATAGVLSSPTSTNPTELSNCRTWIGFHWYGPQNVAFVAGLLPGYRVGMLPGFDGTLDLEKIVVGGWSGGTESTLVIAGARQRFIGAAGTFNPPQIAVPGVVAFFADAPRGPEWAGYGSGFQEDSFYSIDSRPMLLNTARDDRGPDGDGIPASRVASFFAAAKGGKVLSYSWTPASAGGPNHSTMDINDAIDEATGEPAAGCNNALREAHCQALESLGVAFLDAHVRQFAAAHDWFASGNFKTYTLDRIELHRR